MKFSINKRLAYRLTIIGLFALSSTANTAIADDDHDPAPPGIDPGYSSLPSKLIDVNDDGIVDYCRFVGPGTPDQMFISCALGTPDGGFQESLRNFRSAKGIDQGYPTLPRGFKLAEYNGEIGFCRFFGNYPTVHERCLLTGTKGFNGGELDKPENVQNP